MARLLGTVIWFDNDWGFGSIVGKDKETLFFERGAIKPEGLKMLHSGDLVSLERWKGHATNVCLVAPAIHGSGGDVVVGNTSGDSANQ